MGGSKEELHLLSRPAGRIVIDRDEIDQADVDELRFVAPSVSKKERLVGCGKTLVGDLFPPAKWLPKYQKSFLPGDLISGMTVAMIRLPQDLRTVCSPVWRRSTGCTSSSSSALSIPCFPLSRKIPSGHFPSSR